MTQETASNQTMNDVPRPRVEWSFPDGPDGETSISLIVPTDEGDKRFTLGCERSADGDHFVVSIPWFTLEDPDEEHVDTRISNGVYVTNGIAYLGTPDDPEGGKERPSISSFMGINEGLSYFRISLEVPTYNRYQKFEISCEYHGKTNEFDVDIPWAWNLGERELDNGAKVIEGVATLRAPKK